MSLLLTWLDPTTLFHFQFVVILLIHFQKTRFCPIILASEQLNLSFVYLYRNFILIRSYLTTLSWVDIDFTPCIVFCIV